MMFTSQRTADGKETKVGIGWRIGADSLKRQVLHHAGSINGGRSVILIYPESGVVISLLSNLGSMPIAIEQTAQIMAAPFIDIAEKRERMRARLDLAGMYDYFIESEKQSDSGTMEIAHGDGAGWISIPKQFSEFARRVALPAEGKMKLVNASASSNETSLVIVSPLGLFPLRIHSAADGHLAGEIKCPLGPQSLEMNIRIKKRPQK